MTSWRLPTGLPVMRRRAFGRGIAGLAALMGAGFIGCNEEEVTPLGGGGAGGGTGGGGAGGPGGGGGDGGSGGGGGAPCGDDMAPSRLVPGLTSNLAAI